MWLARISLTLSLHVSLSFIAFGRSSGLHPVSSHSCCMNVRAGRPAFDWPYAGVHKSTSLTISSWLVAVQLAPCGMLLPGPVQYCSRHSCIIAVELLLQPFRQRPSSASIQQYRHDRCLEETAFHFISQVWFPYDWKPIDSDHGDHSQGWPEGTFSVLPYTSPTLLLSQDFSTLPLIRTLKFWVLSKEASSTIFKVFGMTRPGIEPGHWRTL